MKIIRCFPSQEAVKGHGRSHVLYRISLWFTLLGPCFTRYKKSCWCMFHAFTASQLLDFKLNAVKDASFTNVSPLHFVKDSGFLLWNRFCTICAYRCTILPYCVKHVRVWKKGMFHNICLKIRKMKDGESVKLSPGEKSLLVVTKSLFTMLKSVFGKEMRIYLLCKSMRVYQNSGTSSFSRIHPQRCT